MNKKQNPQEVLSKNLTIRYTEDEYVLLKEKTKSVNTSLSEYCRRMSLEGYIQAAQPIADLNEIRAFKNILLEYRTNFNRISNKMKASDPYLNEDVKNVVEQIQYVLNRLKL